MVARTTRRRWADYYELDEWDGDDDWWTNEPIHCDYWGHPRDHWHGWCDHGYGQGMQGGCDQTAGAMDTSDAKAPPWIYNPADGGDGVAWGGRAWKKGRWHDTSGDDAQGRHHHGDGGGEGRSSGTHEQAHQHDAATPTAVPPAPPTPTPEEVALNQRRQAVWDQAQNESVEVSCEDLLRMSAEELEAWAAAHLGQI